jgi:hypothetical protein
MHAAVKLNGNPARLPNSRVRVVNFPGSDVVGVKPRMGVTW